MKAIIIEDEKAAVRNLTSLLDETHPETEIIAVIDSIADSIEWFSAHPMPDLVFMDIHLADGSAFEIFEHTDITCPIIFTTAYDEYALRAFKVNSIDYLLKPIDKDEMERAFAKLVHLSRAEASLPDSHTEGEHPLADIHAGDEAPLPVLHADNLLHLIRSLRKQESYKTHFLIPVKGDKLLPVSVDMIRLFYIKDCLVKAVLTDGMEYAFPQTLDELTECLDPTLFFRANRQYLLSREAIKDIDLWFNSRLSINLHHPIANEKILVSKARVAEFKEWFGK